MFHTLKMLLGSIFSIALGSFVLKRGLKTKDYKTFIFFGICLLGAVLFFTNAFFGS